MFHGGFKKVSKDLLNRFQVSIGFQDSFMEVSRKFQENFKVLNRSLKLLRGCFKVVLFLKVYCSMSLIAATRAEGGLVY